MTAHRGFINEDTYDRQRARVIEDIYTLVYNKFEAIRNEIVKSSLKKEELFTKLIQVLENRGHILIQQIERADIDRTSLKNIIQKTIEKIYNYKKTHKIEKNNLLCRLSTKIGSDLAMHVNQYL
jgi:ribosome-binding protein aMBF1 (putative translation factor)